ncbi:MAG: hypothetical protein GC179_23365 [Anaerolineaceae bacterium]|nr:hypothetical protein [Anaerolineaceae bacterium]
MSRLFRSLSAAVIMAAVLGIAGLTYKPTYASGACYRLQAMTDASGLYVYGILDYPSGNLVYLDFNTVAGNTNVTIYAIGDKTKVNILETYNGLAAIVPAEDIAVAWGDASVTEVDSEGACTEVLGIMDGRLNRRDLGAVSFIFPTQDGLNVVEFDRTAQHGLIEFKVTKADITAALEAAQKSGQNQQIGDKSGQLYGSKLYALTSGECQLNANQPDGKLYTFIFKCQ